jgi:hypothetical protein
MSTKRGTGHRKPGCRHFFSSLPEKPQSRRTTSSTHTLLCNFLLRALIMSSSGARGHLRQAIQPFERPINYVSRAFTAASYPLRGIYYFLRHPSYYPLFLGRLLPLSLISILVYTILFTFAFLPQYAFLAIFHGWGAWVNAVVLVLGEGLVIIQGLFEGFFVDECRVDVFDVRATHTTAIYCICICRCFQGTNTTDIRLMLT